MYRTALFSMILNDLYPQFQGHAFHWRWISQKRYGITDSYNKILIGTYTRPTQQCHFRMTLSDLERLSKIFNDTKRRAISLWQLSFLYVIIFIYACWQKCFTHTEQSSLSYMVSFCVFLPIDVWFVSDSATYCLQRANDVSEMTCYVST